MTNLFVKIRYDLIKSKVITPFKKYNYIFRNKEGIEIGGMSKIFCEGGIIPIYNVVANIDNCNFSSNTKWEKNLKEGLNFKFCKDNSVGYQYILDATDLNKIPSRKYDFLISSNVLEHIANPIKALLEWKRVVKKNGYLLVVVPNKKFNFDHNRKYTKFSHILFDYNNNTKENDLTHLNEIIEHHDITLDLGAKNKRLFKRRAYSNYENRCLHHHVFNSRCLRQMFNYIDVEVIKLYNIHYNYMIIGRIKSN